MHAFDRQTNKQTEVSPLDRICIPCSVVKINPPVYYAVVLALTLCSDI